MMELRTVPLTDLTLALRVRRAAERGHPPAVLLPGTGRTASGWDAVAAGLAARRDVHAVDMRGHGASDWPGVYDLSLFAADVIGVLESLDEAPVDLIGHSLGGLVACLVAADRPGLIRRLVLEDIGVPHPREPATPARPAGDLPFDWRVVEQVRPLIDDPDPGWPAVFARITAPTLVIAGGTASSVPQQDVAALAAILPDGRLVTIEAGHLVHETRPAEFLAALTAFLDG